MSPIRVWAPFLIGFLAGIGLIAVEVPIGKFLGLYSPLMGYAAVEVWGGLAIGFVAALVSRTWRGLLTLVLGFLALGATIGAVSGASIPFASVFMALMLGFFGVPAYAIVISAVYVIGRLRRPAEGIGPG